MRNLARPVGEVLTFDNWHGRGIVRYGSSLRDVNCNSLMIRSVYEDDFASLTQPQAASLEVYRTRMDLLWKQPTCNKSACFLWFTLIDPTGGFPVAPDTFLLPANFGDICLPKPSIRVVLVAGPYLSPSQHGVKAFTVEIKAANIALFVWLSAHSISGHFSDNGFLLKDRTTTVNFYTRENITAALLQATLTVNSLADCVKKCGSEAGG
ncbi:hypothetical protein V5799_024023 [Amblyomma americanum]|uniref:Beta-mannosidase Ig-fold domain-containing protein n=1 Tax=Amblyomma americanum TaxID=6943 RepID=A0AAQ4EDB9_AMBAM